jgi:hypothetical protein
VTKIETCYYITELKSIETKIDQDESLDENDFRLLSKLRNHYRCALESVTDQRKRETYSVLLKESEIVLSKLRVKIYKGDENLKKLEAEIRESLGVELYEVLNKFWI